MEPAESQRADALDLTWDAVLDGQPISSRPDHDSDLAQLITELHAAIATPSLFPDRRQAWDEFKRRTALSNAPLASTNLEASSTQFTFNGRVAAPISPRPASPALRPFRSAAMGLLATAALLLLTLAAGLVATWQGSQPDDDLIAVPALVLTADDALGPPGASTVIADPLFAATFAADQLPTGETGAVFYQLTLAPGATMPNLGGLSCGCSPYVLGPGVGIERVQSGEYTVQLDAPIRIQRGGVAADTEELPARTEITLGPGDVAIYSKYDTRGEIRNNGSAPVEVVGVVIVESVGSRTPPTLPEGVQGKVLSQTVPSAWQILPPGPLTVTLRQVTLPADATLGPYEAVGLETVQVERGSVSRSFLGPGETEPRGRSLFHAGSSATAFASISPGTRRIITNVGDEPALLLVATIEPATSGLALLGQ
jgi:hypothetical protein